MSHKLTRIYVHKNRADWWSFSPLGFTAFCAFCLAQARVKLPDSAKLKITPATRVLAAPTCMIFDAASFESEEDVYDAMMAVN